MNKRLSSTQPLDKAIASFIFFKSAEGLADNTIYSYQKILDLCRTRTRWGESYAWVYSSNFKNRS